MPLCIVSDWRELIMLFSNESTDKPGLKALFLRSSESLCANVMTLSTVQSSNSNAIPLDIIVRLIVLCKDAIAASRIRYTIRCKCYIILSFLFSVFSVYSLEGVCSCRHPLILRQETNCLRTCVKTEIRDIQAIDPIVFPGLMPCPTHPCVAFFADFYLSAPPGRGIRFA